MLFLVSLTQKVTNSNDDANQETPDHHQDQTDRSDHSEDPSENHTHQNPEGPKQETKIEDHESGCQGHVVDHTPESLIMQEQSSVRSVESFTDLHPTLNGHQQSF